MPEKTNIYNNVISQSCENISLMKISFSALKIAIQKLNDQEGRQVFFRPARGAWRVCAGKLRK